MNTETIPALPKEKLETILVVENDETVRDSVVSILEGANFHVHSADDGFAALDLASKMEGRIDLLISDVTMPEISGPDLGEALKRKRPDTRVLLISGKKSGNLLILNYGWVYWVYMRKPFVALKLLAMVNQALHSQDLSRPGGQGFNTRKDTQ